MDLGHILTQRARVESFMREHRTSLLTMVLGTAGPAPRPAQTDGEAPTQGELARRVLGMFAEAAEVSGTAESFFAVFTKPSDAVRFAMLVQAERGRLGPAKGAATLDRIGVHLGEVSRGEAGGASPDLFGLHLEMCARLQGLAVAGQVLLTRAAFDNARQVLKGEDLPGVGDLHWLNHGCYELKGLDEAVEICEVGEVGSAPLAAPPDSETARKRAGGEGEPVLGWRPAVGQGVPGTAWDLVRKLGEGGFGEVWLGRNRASMEERVLKFCFRADRVRSLRREVTIWKLLKERLGSHPNIVPVREVFFEAPPFYLVMDYTAGQDLGSWCERQGGVAEVPLGTRLEIAAQVVEALGAAHRAGVIHRDVKPGNILIEEEAGGGVRARLTDFGIGQVLEAQGADGGALAGFTGTFAGTESRTGSQIYMAPELWTGGPATAASDMYALGVVLYQLLSGNLKAAIPADWEEHIREPALRDWVARFVAGDPNERMVDSAGAARGLRQIESAVAGGEQITARAVARKRNRSRALYVVGLLFAGLGTAGWLWSIWAPVGLYPELGLARNARSVFAVLLAAGLGSIGVAVQRASWMRLACLFGLALAFGPLLYQATGGVRSGAWRAAAAVAGAVYLALLLGWGGGRSRVKFEQQFGAEARRRLHRPLFSRRGWVGFACVPLLIWLFYAVENYRGRRAWESHLASLKARGIAAEWRDLAAPAIPDDQNFCRAPGMPAFLLDKAKFDQTLASQFPHPGGQPIPLVAMKEAAEGEARTAMAWNQLRLPQDGPPRDFAVRARRLTEALARLAGESGVQFRTEPKLQERLDREPSSDGFRYSYERKGVSPRDALAEFFRQNALRVVAQDPDGCLLLGSRPCSPQAVLDWYAAQEPLHRTLRQASARPRAQVAILAPAPSWEEPIPNFVPFRLMSQNLASHATACELLGDHETATQDLVAILRLAEACGSSRNSLVSSMMQVAITGLAASVVEEWLREGLGQPTQWARLQREFAGGRLPEVLQRGLWAERLQVSSLVLARPASVTLARELDLQLAFGMPQPPMEIRTLLATMAGLSEIGPAGWRFQSARRYSESMISGKLPTLDARGRLVPPEPVSEPDSKLGTVRAWFRPSEWALLCAGQGRTWLPNYTGTGKATARNQRLAMQAATALALEQYRAASGRYPDRLEDLVPKYATSLPPDVITAQPLKYRVLPQGGYLLYSVGWDGQDDGGQGGAPVGDQESKDWVWQGVPARP